MQEELSEQMKSDANRIIERTFDMVSLEDYENMKNQLRRIIDNYQYESNKDHKKNLARNQYREHKYRDQNCRIKQYVKDVLQNYLRKLQQNEDSAEHWSEQLQERIDRRIHQNMMLPSTSQNQAPQIIHLITPEEKNTLFREAYYDLDNRRRTYEYIMETYQTNRPICQNHETNIMKWVNIARVKSQNKVDLSQNGWSLIPNQRNFNMQTFLLDKNWNHIEFLGLQNCRIDDAAWRSLIENSNKFINLKWLIIDGNQITTVREGDLNRFASLQRIDFSMFANGPKNPLSPESINILKRFKQNHPDTILIYDFKSLEHEECKYGLTFY